MSLNNKFPIAMGKEFITYHHIRFADCDPAGIAFYPRLLEMTNNVIEEWFNGPLEYSFKYMHQSQNCGIPVKTLHIDFNAPGLLGDTIEWRLSVDQLRNSGVTLLIHAIRPDGVNMLKVQLTIVHCTMVKDKLSVTPFPKQVMEHLYDFYLPEKRNE